jgi:hypothetical protein
MVFFFIATISDWIDFGHPTTWVMDFNEFNDFLIFINYFYLFI